MLIHISASNPKPMYEQVVDEIQRLIVTGQLQQDEMLPSIRELSTDLRTSAITIRRAYQELEREGFIYTRAGKGSFVARLSAEKLMQWKMEQVKQPLWEAVLQAKRLDLTEEQVRELFADMWLKADQIIKSSGQGGESND